MHVSCTLLRKRCTLLLAVVCCSLAVRHLVHLDCAALAHPLFRTSDLVQLRGSVVATLDGNWH